MTQSKAKSNDKSVSKQSNSNGVRTTNRHPAKISPAGREPVKVLASNVDTLVLSLDIAWGKDPLLFTFLSEAKDSARANKTDCPMPFWKDTRNTEEYIFNVKGFGSKGYEWILENQEYSLVVGNWTKPQAMPSAVVTIRSETLWRKGPRNAVQFILNFFKREGGDIQKMRVSRADLCLDALLPSSLWNHDLLNHVITRAASDDVRTNRNRRKLSTIGIGKNQIQARLYDKPLEIKQKSNKTWFYDIWGVNILALRARLWVAPERGLVCLAPSGGKDSCPTISYYFLNNSFCSAAFSFFSWNFTYLRIISASSPTVSTQ